MNADLQKTGSGAGFWIVWWAAGAALFGGFIGGMWWVKSIGEPLWGVIGVALIFGTALFGLAWAADRRCYGAAGARASARRLYQLRLGGTMGAYVVLLAISVRMFRSDTEPTGALAWVLALAPALPLLGAIWTMLQYLADEKDEYLRTIQTQSFILATGFVMAIATVWGFLDQFGKVGHAEMWLVFPLWALCLAPAQLFVRRRYQ